MTVRLQLRNGEYDKIKKLLDDLGIKHKISPKKLQITFLTGVDYNLFCSFVEPKLYEVI